MNTDRKFGAALLVVWVVLGGGWLWAAPGTSPAPAVQKARILLVTGVDYPGHHWRETAPALAEAAFDAYATDQQAKDFARADEIRKELAAKGITLEDTPKGTIWRKG